MDVLAAVMLTAASLPGGLCREVAASEVWRGYTFAWGECPVHCYRGHVSALLRDLSCEALLNLLIPAGSELPI